MRIETPYPVVVMDGQSIGVDTAYTLDLSEPILYEVLRVIEGKPLFYKDHLERFQETAKLTGMAVTDHLEAIKRGAVQLLQETGLQHDNIKLVAGAGSRGFTWAWYGVKGFYPPVAWYEEGIHVTLIQETRDNPNAKVIHATLAAKVDAMRAEGKFFEGLLVDPEGFVLEGSRSNLFFIKGRNLVTARSEMVLKGITRWKLLKILDAHGIGLEERDIAVSELSTFDGAMITGTSIDLLPIQAIDTLVYNTAQLPLMSDLLIWYREAMTASLSDF